MLRAQGKSLYQLRARARCACCRGTAAMPARASRVATMVGKREGARMRALRLGAPAGVCPSWGSRRGEQPALSRVAPRVRASLFLSGLPLLGLVPRALPLPLQGSWVGASHCWTRAVKMLAECEKIGIFPRIALPGMDRNDRKSCNLHYFMLGPIYHSMR